MDRLDFLRAVLPPGTRYALRFIKKTGGSNTAKNIFYATVDDAADDIDLYCSAGWDVYYATAGFGAGTLANADNVVAKRELYVDVDCGQGKPYADKAQGLQALVAFVTKLGLPKPTLLDSGNGIHAHWVFDSAVPVHEWMAVASSLKKRCVAEGFHVDGACTADVARVLRVPGTINTKGGAETKLLTPVKYRDFAALCDVIGVDAPDESDMFKRARERTRSAGAASEVSKLLAGNKVSKFETIWIKSVQGTGCAQIKHAIEEADTLPEPLWRAVLSIAHHCEDRDWAIHEVSKGHGSYTPEETEAKASLTKGPYTCETYQSMDSAHLCNGCEHAGRITSPIQLGAELKAAEPADLKVEVDSVHYDITPYPEPYFRGKKGGIYTYVKKDDETYPVLIYPHDLYAFQRMRDVENGDVVWIRHHMPNDGVREFAVLQRDINALDRFRDRISEQGVSLIATHKEGPLVHLQRLIALQVQELQQRDKAEIMNTRFGWTRHNTFIVGNREYTKDGVKVVPVVRALEHYVHWFEPKGSLDVWKHAASMYEGTPNYLHAYGLLSGFGSILMQLSPENGAVVNFYSKRSGTGKTTILKMINSIFGDPKALMKDAQDTKLSKVHRMGLMNGMCTTLDEMTNVPPQELSDLLYGSTQGRARDRMKSGENAERVNSIVWKSNSVWSSNAAVEARLGLIKYDPQGELARLLEFHLQTPVPPDVLEAQKVFNQLSTNYGHAGDIFLRYVVPNLDDVVNLWEKVRDKIYRMQKWTQTERYRLNQVVCAITAGVITNQLGLTNYDIKGILKQVLDIVHKVGVESRQNETNASEIIASYINGNVNSMLIIADGLKNGLQVQPSRTPTKGTLLVRYEPDTDTLYIVKSEFDKWCATIFINPKEVPNMLSAETSGASAMTPIVKRIGKGWEADFGSVRTYRINNARAILGSSMEDLGPSTEDDG